MSQRWTDSTARVYAEKFHRIIHASRFPARPPCQSARMIAARPPSPPRTAHPPRRASFPESGLTITRSEFVSALMMDDFPTFGRPTMASFNGPAISGAASACASSPISSVDVADVSLPRGPFRSRQISSPSPRGGGRGEGGIFDGRILLRQPGHRSAAFINTSIAFARGWRSRESLLLRSPSSVNSIAAVVEPLRVRLVRPATRTGFCRTCRNRCATSRSNGTTPSCTLTTSTITSAATIASCTSSSATMAMTPTALTRLQQPDAARVHQREGASAPFRLGAHAVAHRHPRLRPCTMAMRRPAMWLNSADFPTFGRPTMAINPDMPP